MKFDIFGIFTAISLSATTPVPQNREVPLNAEPRLPEIDFALLAAVARPKNEARPGTQAGFAKQARANA